MPLFMFTGLPPRDEVSGKGVRNRTFGGAARKDPCGEMTGSRFLRLGPNVDPERIKGLGVLVA